MFQDIRRLWRYGSKVEAVILSYLVFWLIVLGILVHVFVIAGILEVIGKGIVHGCG